MLLESLLYIFVYYSSVFKLSNWCNIDSSIKQNEFNIFDEEKILCMYYKCPIIVTIGSNSPFFTWDFFVSQSVWKSRQRKNPQNGQNDWQKGLEGCTRIMFQIQCRWKSYMHRNDKLRCCMRGGGGHLYKRILLDPKTSKRKW